MTYINDLKPGDFARIVEIEKILDSNHFFTSLKSLEGCFIKITSDFNNLVFTSYGKTFVISKGFTKKIRVIKLYYNKRM